MSFRRYPKYRDSGVEWLGQVPEHWEVKRLRYVASLNPSKKEISDRDPATEASFLPMEAIGDDGTLDLEQTRPLADLVAGYTYFREGDVTLAKITPCFENSKGAVMRGLLNGVGFGTTELIVARPISGQTSSEYLHWLFTSHAFRKAGESFMYGAGGQKRVPDEFVRNFRIAFPPPAEQAAIVTFLDRETAEIDALIAEQQRLIELLQEKRQAVISHAVTKGLNPDVPMKDSGVAWLGLVPAHWNLTRLRRVVVHTNAGEVIDKSYWGPGPELLYTCAMDPLQSDYQDFPVVKRTGASDLLLTRNGTPYVHKPHVDSIYTNVVQRITLRNDLDRDFMAVVLQNSADNLRGYGVSIESLNYEMWKGLPIAIPPLSEQKAIVTFLDQSLHHLDDLYTEIGRAITLLNERRSALISAAVTGQIDVRDHISAEAA